METIESNYKIARRVYQQLHLDISELFAEFVRSRSNDEIEQLNNDIRANGWGIKKVTEVLNAEELMNILQTFYTLTGRLPLTNGLLVVPDRDAQPGENKVNMKQLYELFKNIKSHGIRSLPFLGLIKFYLEKNDYSLIKNATTELYSNLSCMTLSGARDFRLKVASDLTAKISFLLRKATLQNHKMREIEQEVTAEKINNDRLFTPKSENPLDGVVEILDNPDIEHKKSVSILTTSPSDGRRNQDNTVTY